MGRSTPIGDEISIDGGLSNTPYFCQFLADVVKSRINVADHPELTAIGCAQMASEGLEDVAPGSLESRVYEPQGNTPHDWIEQIAEIVARR